MSESSSRNHPEQHHEHTQPSDELSLGDLIASLWRQRVPVLLSLLGGGAVGAMLLGLMLAFVPGTEITSVGVRLRFAGAAEGNYPNGMPFQPADIVAPSVVRPLYTRLGLNEFLPFGALKSALTVIETNEAMEAIRREFEAKLNNPRITQAEREALEKEFSSRRQSARTGEYRIQFMSAAGAEVPRPVAEALLPALLESWAEQAQKVKGAWLYDVAVPGQGLLSTADLETEDYLVVVDMLRLTLKRVDDALAKLAQIPGAQLVRAPGNEGLSIIESRSRLDDMLRFKIEPLFAQVYGQGVFRDRDATTRYLEHRLFKLGLDAKALADKSSSIENVLNQLSNSNASSGDKSQNATNNDRAVVIPQFGGGFMDRMMEVGAQTADVEFRRELSKEIVSLRAQMIDIELEQNLYQALLKGFSAVRDVVDLKELTGEAGNESPTRFKQTKEAIEKRFAEVTAETRYLIDQLQGLHKVISEDTLQPQNIYAITTPVERARSSTVNLRSIAGIMLVSLMLGGLIGVAVAWRREVARNSERASGH